MVDFVFVLVGIAASAMAALLAKGSGEAVNGKYIVGLTVALLLLG